MYGTVARMRVKPGMDQALKKQQEGFEALKIPGFVRATVYQMDANSSEYYLAVVFESKAAYQANANDPAQNQRYQEMRALLAEEPEWHDGEITHSTG